MSSVHNKLLVIKLPFPANTDKAREPARYIRTKISDITTRSIRTTANSANYICRWLRRNSEHSLINVANLVSWHYGALPDRSRVAQAIRRIWLENCVSAGLFNDQADDWSWTGGHSYRNCPNFDVWERNMLCWTLICEFLQPLKYKSIQEPADSIYKKVINRYSKIIVQVLDTWQKQYLPWEEVWTHERGFAEKHLFKKLWHGYIW